MKNYFRKAFKIVDTNGYLSEADFIKKMGYAFVKKYFPNVSWPLATKSKPHFGRVNDPERIVQTPRRLAGLPLFVREKVLKGLPVNAKIGTMLEAAWSRDREKLMVAQGISEETLRALDSELVKVLDNIGTKNKREATMRSYREIKAALDGPLSYGKRRALLWVLREADL